MAILPGKGMSTFGHFVVCSLVPPFSIWKRVTRSLLIGMCVVAHIDWFDTRTCTLSNRDDSNDDECTVDAAHSIDVSQHADSAHVIDVSQHADTAHSIDVSQHVDSAHSILM